MSGGELSSKSGTAAHNESQPSSSHIITYEPSDFHEARASEILELHIPFHQMKYEFAECL